MKDYGYLFDHFKNQVVTEQANDQTKTEIERVAQENGLTVVFNRVGDFSQGRAAVVPPENEVTVNLTQGADDKWRVKNVR